MSWSAPEDWSRWDPDKLMVCPYDEVHMIKAKRFQHHLLKCRENHPEKDFVNCPFNAKHVMLRHELRQHVSRCPDRSVIEHYNYKGSEKDEDGFYFKGNTSVPSYHRTEELQEPSESWDNHDVHVEGNPQQSNHNNRERSLRHQGSSQMSTMVTDTLSLSPEERDRFKQQMRREAAQRSTNTNSGTQLPSRMCSTSQGYNTNVDIYGQQYSQRTNPVFRHCVEQGAISSLSQQQAARPQTASAVSCTQAQQQAHYDYDSNLAHSGSIASNASQPRNRIYQYCLEKIHESQQARELPTVFGASNEQYQTQFNIHGDRNLVKPRGAGETFSAHHTSKTPPPSSTDANLEFRSGFIESEMQNKLKLIVRGKSGVAAVSNVCGQPTSPTSAGVNSPQLAGVGRARLHAEARKNNFGGICFSPPKATETEATRTPPVGRGRGMLNFMYSS